MEVDKTSLRFISWNIALVTQSQQAPDTWTQTRAVAAITRLLEANPSDVIALQEVPASWNPDIAGYLTLEAETTSHSGRIITLLSKKVVASNQIVTCPVHGSAVLVDIGGLVTVANVHLCPGPFHQERYAQLSDIVETNQNSHLLVVGDTNTRGKELAAIETLGLVTVRPPSPTLDWRRNRFHRDRPNIPRISSYYTRAFTTANIAVSGMAVWNQPTKTGDGTEFFLSDHFALSGTATTH